MVSKQRIHPLAWGLVLILALMSSACGITGNSRQSTVSPGYGGRGNAGGGMGPGNMGPGIMGSDGMGPGMMGGSGQPQRGFGTSSPTSTPGGSSKVSFRQDVLPVFDQSCVNCHGGEGGLYLDNYDHVMAGGEDGPVVIPGKPSQSMLVQKIDGTSQPRMPLGGPPLPTGEINIIVTWVKEGAPNN